jgi:hypothetical protein
MTIFNTNPNQFSSSILSLKKDFHAFTISGVPKGTKSEKQQKQSLFRNVSKAIDSIDTDDFGIRVVVMKTKD